MNTQPDSSQELIVRSQDGDLTAFQQLVEQYQGYAFTLAFRFLGDEDEANDTVQETFIRVWKHIAKFNFSSKFTTWLFRIVTNLCLDRLKAGKRKSNVISADYKQDDLPEPADLYNPEDDYIKKDLVKTITILAAELSPKQRIVFVLRDLQDLNINETAQIANMSLNSVKSNLCCARRKIREKLERLNYPGGN